MEKRIVLLLFAVIFFFNAWSEKISTLPVKINWNGVDAWTANGNTKYVVSFDDAEYPDNDLPYFSKIIDCDKNSEYTASLTNEVYAPISQREKELLKNKEIPNNITLKTFVLTERGNKYLKVQILPFVKKEGVVLKLLSFDLSINNIPSPLKAPSQTIHSYASNSVLAQGKFVKIAISESGIYKLTYENLVSMGVDPANVRIFGYGGAMLGQSFLTKKIDDLPECAIYMNKGSDGVFNAGDYILFYAQGVNSWAFDNGRGSFIHTINTYSTKGYYFVTSDAGNGKKISENSITAPTESVVNNVDEFIDYQVYEKELVSIANSGKVLYGERFDDVTKYNFPFTFPNIVKNSTVKIRTDLMGYASQPSGYTLKLNNKLDQTIAVPAIDDGYSYGKVVNSSFSLASTDDWTDNLLLTLSYNKSTSSAYGYLNYIEITARRKLVMNGSVMFFRNTDNLASTGAYNKFQLSGANDNVQVWDITDPQNIKKMASTNSGGKLEFIDVADAVKQYVAVDPVSAGAFSQPVIGSAVENQNLHSMDATDFLIITSPRFLTQANKLADAHRSKDNLRVNVVTTEQVYNEFSSGTPDATAYRWVAKMLYDRALNSNNTQNIPKYLLLFGRGSYDNRKLLIPSSESMVLSYQSDESLHSVNSYTSDDYFGLLDDSEGTDLINNLVDIGVGRFTALNDEQATNVVNKTVNYIENKNKGIWKNQLCFIGDDGGNGDGSVHMFQADSVARTIYRINKSIQLNKIYLDAYKQEVNASGERYPLARAKFQNLLNSGLFMMNFTGHASAFGLTNEQIVTKADTEEYYNVELPLWIAATCDFAVVDGNETSAGENVLLNPNGGGIGIFAAARTVYSGSNFILNKSLCKFLFTKSNGAYPRLGDVVRNAKREIKGEMNKLSYGLFADPALKLAYPSDCNVITDKINNKIITGNDTIKALSVDSIQGHIEDFSGNILNDFNGTVDVNIYDKNQRITTLNNHNEGGGTFVFDDRPNILYSGKASVKNGYFSVSFMMPKDIRYNYGTGRINYYCSDKNTEREGQGNFENFIVGGASSIFDKTDTIGPEITAYLNYKTFKSGDKVNETPLFLAEMSDKNGINTVGSGIGYDIRLVIDDNPSESYILNEYFVADADSYTSGGIQFKLPTLTEGKHTLTFRCWDLLNNSATSKIDFEVVKGLTPNIFGVSCYPNPANIKTNFVVIHDRPETVLETTIEVFDLAGRKIWNKTQSTADNLSWDLTDSNGNKIQRGIYLYRISIKTSNSVYTSKTNKILVASSQ